MYVLDEAETLEQCQTKSVARFGDGELRLAIGGECSSQAADPRLRLELVNLLQKDAGAGLVVAIPNFPRNARRDVWDKYAGPPFAGLFRLRRYGSAFITRPDNAPWIDTPAYWDRVRDLWRGQDVVLILGDRKSLTPEQMRSDGARSCVVLEAPRQHAYKAVAELEEAAAQYAGRRVLLCLGATATVLAARLHRRGLHALDLGHIGMFMRHAGAYVDPSTLISKEYRAQNVELHKRPEGFGGDGKKHAERIYEYARAIGARSICDYGCGEGTLRKALVALGWAGFFAEYDPAMKGKAHLPKPAQLVACTDVLEHIEPDYLDAVLRHMFAVAELAAFVTIATRPANKILPDGRNAHLIQQAPQWWVDKLRAIGWDVANRFDKMKGDNCREVWLWLKKKPAPRDATALAVSTGAPK